MATPKPSLWRRGRYRAMQLWSRVCPGIALPVRQGGHWWFAETDANGVAIWAGLYEVPERQFLERLLQPGMRMLDLGAHHGFYTLLASKRVGQRGGVVAFEPSPREYRLLTRHVRLNRCVNVTVEPIAVADAAGTADFYVVDRWDTGCNSLRRPHTQFSTHCIQVQTTTLDAYVERQGGLAIDVIKLDVEGSEWAVLRGAEQLLSRRPRPIMLCELDEGRTAPWGYRAGAIYEHLAQKGFRWFRVIEGGRLVARSSTEEFRENLVAVPDERVSQMRGLST